MSASHTWLREEGMTVREVAPLIGRSVDWIKRHRHELPFCIAAPGRHPRFSARGLQKWLAELQKEASGIAMTINQRRGARLRP